MFTIFNFTFSFIYLYFAFVFHIFCPPTCTKPLKKVSQKSTDTSASKDTGFIVLKCESV